MTEMTTAQARYLSYIHAYIQSFGLSPTQSEIARGLGVAAPSVHQMMKTLENKEIIRRLPGVPQSIEILVARDSIPKWKGKRISRTVIEWTLDRPASRIRSAKENSASPIYRLKIVLVGTSPPIWRRIETKDVSLGELHDLIQTAMGWTNSHSYEFQVADIRYSVPEILDNSFGDLDAIDESGVRISALCDQHGPKLRMNYMYDFGDSWEHVVTFEKIIPPESGASYPRCTGGKRACPPEDIGGVFGFGEFVEAITDPSHELYAEFLDLYGPFDPEYFDPAEATRQMKKGLPR